MPGSFVPHASASHRVACISLYKAFLQQTSLLQAQPSINGNLALSQVVRYRFRRDCRLVSPTQVANGLNTGYAVLDLIHACNNGDKDAWGKLTQLVESVVVDAESTSAWRATLANERRPMSPRKLPKLEHNKIVASKEKQERYPSSKPILERPLPLSEIRGGTRRVPSLITTQGIPFLRYSKPQPVSLSRVIRQRIKWNERAWNLKGLLEEAIVMAKFEDKWDRILEEEHGIVDGDVSCDPSWTDEFRKADGDVLMAIRARDRKYAEMGTLMWEIVKKEKALKEQEKMEKKAVRRAAWEARQAANGASSSDGTEERVQPRYEMTSSLDEKDWKQ